MIGTGTKMYMLLEVVSLGAVRHRIPTGIPPITANRDTLFANTLMHVYLSVYHVSDIPCEMFAIINYSL